MKELSHIVVEELLELVPGILKTVSKGLRSLFKQLNDLS